MNFSYLPLSCKNFTNLVMEKFALFEVFLLSDELPNKHWKILIDKDCEEKEFDEIIDKTLQLKGLSLGDYDLDFDIVDTIIPTVKQQQEIANNGFAIQFLPDIPVLLPKKPTREQTILNIRINSEDHRFFDFQQLTHYDLWEVIVKM